MTANEPSYGRCSRAVSIIAEGSELDGGLSGGAGREPRQRKSDEGSSQDPPMRKCFHQHQERISATAFGSSWSMRPVADRRLSVSSRRSARFQRMFSAQAFSEAVQDVACLWSLARLSFFSRQIGAANAGICLCADNVSVGKPVSKFRILACNNCIVEHATSA